jgi:cytoskeletal protein RodZ
MSYFGETIRKAREAKGLTTSQIAEKTHILVQIINAMEHEDFSQIKAAIYGRGFVKLYCEAVGLDPKPLVDTFTEIYADRHAAPPKAAVPQCGS